MRIKDWDPVIVDQDEWDDSIAPWYAWMLWQSCWTIAAAMGTAVVTVALTPWYVYVPVLLLILAGAVATVREGLRQLWERR